MAKKAQKQPIGEMPCPIRSCSKKAAVFKYAQRAEADERKRFAGKLYSVCAAGHRCEDQSIILSEAHIWRPDEKHDGGDAKPTPSSGSSSNPTLAPKPAAASSIKPQPQPQPNKKPASLWGRLRSSSGWGFFQ